MTSFDLRVLKWIFCMIFASVLLYIFEFEFRSFLISKNRNDLNFRRVFLPQEEQSKGKYVIVLDGGSSGTRIHVFQFSNNSEGNITLEEGIAVKTKPGLANFADQPQNVVQNITYLLDWAKENIPVENWNETPITLKGSAALRLLTKSVSSAILDDVHKILKVYPFYCPNECVSLLKEDDEGIFGWYTLNYLIGRLNDLNNAAAYIETGGGSFQVTFPLGNQATPKLSRIINSSFPSIKQKPLTIYTRSYSGLGFLNARFSFLQTSMINLDLGKEIGKNTFISSCVQPSHAGFLHYNNEDYLVIGQKNKNFSFEYCYQKVVDFLGNRVEKIEELKKREIYVSGVNSAMSKPIRKEGDFCTIDTFVSFCKHYCSVKIPYSTLLCFDCTYVAAFLIHGLGLDTEKEIKILNKIDGIQISWCLGIALNMLM